MSPPELLALRDGSTVEVRALERTDRTGLAAAVARLSDRSRYLRFASPKPRLTEHDLDGLLNLDHHRSEAFLAIDPATRQGVGVARYAEFGAEPGVVDVAVTVADNWQRRGLATDLLTRLLARARDEGHTVARASVLAENAPSLALLQRFGFQAVAVEGPQLEMELTLLP